MYLFLNGVHENVLYSLAPLIGGERSDGFKLKQLSYILLRALYPTNPEKLYAQIPLEEFEQALAKKSADFRHETALYHKIKFERKSTRNCQRMFKIG